eukprot:g51725.t1
MECVIPCVILHPTIRLPIGIPMPSILRTWNLKVLTFLAKPPMVKADKTTKEATSNTRRRLLPSKVAAVAHEYIDERDLETAYFFMTHTCTYIQPPRDRERSRQAEIAN